MSDTEQTTSQQLFNHLYEGCNILRGPINQDEFKSYITPILFFFIPMYNPIDLNQIRTLSFLLQRYKNKMKQPNKSKDFLKLFMMAQTTCL